MYPSGSSRDFIMVGMPDTAVRESRERIKSALLNSGFGYPNKAVTINLAPANVRKEGAGFDLPKFFVGSLGRYGVLAEVTFKVFPAPASRLTLKLTTSGAEASAKVSERDAELVAMRNEAFGQIQEALAQATAAQKLLEVYQRSLRPQAQATLRSTSIAYENDRADFLNLLDSQTTVLDIDLAYFQALADFQARLADLELAVGAPIESALRAAPEVVR